MREAAYNLLMQGAFIPAMPLALQANRQFDEAVQRRLVRYYMAAGVDGLAVAVHTTQFEIRNPEYNLLETVLRTAAEEIFAYEQAQGKTILRIAGVCGYTEQAVREARLARSLGYDAVLLSPGGLGGYDENYLIERTRCVAQEIPVIGFYLQPSVGGRIFSSAYWEALCAIPGLVAIKCAPFNRYLTLDVVRAVALSGREIALYTGNDDNIMADLLTSMRVTRDGKEHSARFVGGLLGHWAVWTHTAVDYFHQARAAAQKGEIPSELMALGAQITDANSAFFDTRNQFAGCIAGVHEVLRRQGLFQNILCLNPGETLSPGQMEEIDRVYAAYPALNDDAFVKRFLAADRAEHPHD